MTSPRLIFTLFLLITVFVFPASADMIAGTSTANVDGMEVRLKIEIDTQSDTVKVTMSGPKNKWFGVGFLSDPIPHNGNYVLVASGATAFSVEERQLTGTSIDEGGNLLTPTIAVDSIDMSGVNTEIMLTRDQTIGEAGYYDFPGTAQTINLFWAIGASLEYGFHDYSTLVEDEGAEELVIIQSQISLEPVNVPNPAWVISVSAVLLGLFGSLISLRS